MKVNVYGKTSLQSALGIAAKKPSVFSMGFFGVTQNALGNGAWSFKIVISHPGSSY